MWKKKKKLLIFPRKDRVLTLFVHRKKQRIDTETTKTRQSNTSISNSPALVLISAALLDFGVPANFLSF